MIIKIIVCLIAGMGAGIGTGFAGLSAATVISPMLITFMGFPAYQSIGIALASDVIASASSAYTYKKNNNIDLRNGLIMMASVLIFTLLGSFAGSIVSNTTMEGISVVMTLFLGVRFIVFPVHDTRFQSQQTKTPRQKMIESLVSGIVIGAICGFIGAGGGMMMLMIFTSVLGYELKTAVGTSVFIMTFTAFTGAVSHFSIGGVADYEVLILCVVFTLLGAKGAAVLANRLSNKILSMIIGVMLTVLGINMLIFNYLV